MHQASRVGCTSVVLVCVKNLQALKQFSCVLVLRGVFAEYQVVLVSLLQLHWNYVTCSEKNGLIPLKKKKSYQY